MELTGVIMPVVATRLTGFGRLKTRASRFGFFDSFRLGRRSGTAGVSDFENRNVQAFDNQYITSRLDGHSLILKTAFPGGRPQTLHLELQCPLALGVSRSLSASATSAPRCSANRCSVSSVAAVSAALTDKALLRRWRRDRRSNVELPSRECGRSQGPGTICTKSCFLRAPTPPPARFRAGL